MNEKKSDELGLGSAEESCFSLGPHNSTICLDKDFADLCDPVWVGSAHIL